jgi:hypothetical protein
VPPLSKNPNLEELETTDADQIAVLETKGAPRRLKSWIQEGSMAVEGFIGNGSGLTFLPERFRLNLTGFAEAMNSESAEKEIEPLITETVIEYPDLFRQQLWVRWIETIGFIMLGVHACNTDPRLKKLKEAREKMDKMKNQLYDFHPGATTTTATAQSGATTTTTTATV